MKYIPAIEKHVSIENIVIITCEYSYKSLSVEIQELDRSFGICMYCLGYICIMYVYLYAQEKKHYGHLPNNVLTNL